MRKITYVLACCYLIQGCITKRDKPVITAGPVKSAKTDSSKAIIKQETYGDDTLTKDGKLITYKLNDKKEVIMSWSKGNFKRSKNCGEPFGSYSPPWYIAEWKNYIGVREGCGSPCWLLAILPMNNRDSIFSYPYDLAYDTIRNLILYKPFLNGNEFMVENIVTRKKKKIVLPKSFSYEFFKEGIDSISFTKNGVFIRWITFKNSSDKETEEKIFPIDL
jgi:hypothetical protein